MKRLEDPRSPAQRRRDAEAQRKSREFHERIEAEYPAWAEEWPQGHKDFLAATDELDKVLEETGFDLTRKDAVFAIRDYPEAAKTMELHIRERFSTATRAASLVRIADAQPSASPACMRVCVGTVREWPGTNTTSSSESDPSRGCKPI